VAAVAADSLLQGGVPFAYPQEVLDADGELLVIQTKGVADFQRRLQAQVAETARFLAVYNEHREVPPSEWAMQTGYPWLAAFSGDEAGEFARELVADTFDAAQRGTLEHLEGNLRAWDSTAGVYGQPDAMRMLLSLVDLDGIVKVLPPSEEQVGSTRSTEARACATSAAPTIASSSS
jgi:hypothetical protein